MDPAKIKQFTDQFLKKDLPDLKPGDIVKVHQKIKEGDKQRIQIFEGIVIAIKHGKGISGTITVRKIISGVGVEKIFPLHSPNVEKFEIISRSKVRRAKLYFLRQRSGKKAKLKRKLYVPEEKSASQDSSQEKESIEKDADATTQEDASGQNVQNDNPLNQPAKESQQQNGEKSEEKGK